MNKIKFLTLNVFEKEGCDNPIKSLSAYDIHDIFEELNYTTNYLAKILKEFEKLGWVKRGYDDRRAHTFYITDEGKEALKKLKEEK